MYAYHISMLNRLNVTSCGKFRCQREKFQVRILNRLQACVTIWIIFTLKNWTSYLFTCLNPNEDFN